MSYEDFKNLLTRKQIVSMTSTNIVLAETVYVITELRDKETVVSIYVEHENNVDLIDERKYGG